MRSQVGMEKMNLIIERKDKKKRGNGEEGGRDLGTGGLGDWGIWGLGDLESGNMGRWEDRK